MSDDLFFKFNAKRTRSQLTLPDDILNLPARSPMKDARIAVRNYSTKAASGLRLGDFGESDDELLLSPSKIGQLRQDNQQRISLVPKRSATPPLRDDYSSCSGSPSDGRALKRIKRDVDVNRDGQRCVENVTITESRPPSAHSRSASQPNMGKSLYHQSGLARRQSLSLRTSPVSGKDRARSVPTFPSSFSAPHIDLRNPPPSPWRARSRSPFKEKEIKLRITSGPPQVAKLEIITDNNGPKAETDGSTLAPLPGTPQPLPITINDHTRRNANQETPTNRRAAIRCDDSAGPSIPTVHELPSTPATTLPLYLTIPLSPLTPLPPTPLPTNSINVSKGRYTAAGWEGDGYEDKDDGMIISSQETKLLPADVARKSRLPRPSSIVNLSVMGAHRPSPASTLDRKGATLMGLPSALPAGKETLALEITKQLPVTNAFTILMDRARKGKGTHQPKGKAKETASLIKGGNSSSALATIGPKQKSGKEIRREMAPPKISIKTRMRPKEKITPKPKPISNTVDIVNDDKFYSPPPRANSPMNVSKSNHLPVITPENLPMEAAFATDNNVAVSSPGVDSPGDTFQLYTSTPTPAPIGVSIDVTNATSGANIPQPLSDVSHVPDLPEAATPTANDHSTASEFQTSPPSPLQCNDPASANVDNCLAEPKVNLLPAPATPVNKLPIVNKIRLATTTDRVTRRTSQRQREKQTGMSSQALHNASAIHRGTTRKKLVSPVASDPSTETLAYPQDAETSTSCPLDMATDPASDEPVFPGSPMKLSSPIRRVSTVQEGTIAKLTRLSTVKAVKPPSDTKFASESASPAPTRLVRSTSMISTRPMGSIAHKFTGLGRSQGSSSLSTLANALERLRMPPPERPNTSMGFNRELNTDHDLEPTKYSADDSSVGGRVVENTALKRTAGAESIDSDTGGSGEVHSLRRERVATTKLYSGSGLIMRGGKGTNPHQPKPRICGVGTFGSGRLPKASRKTSLPSVMASPIKGKESVDDMEESEMDFSGFDAAHPNQTDVSSISSLAVGGETEPLARKSPSRRVSLASQALSQSLSSLPPKQTQVMGPPMTPPNRRPGLRSSSSSYPSTSLASRSAISDTVAFTSAPTSLGKVRGGVGSHVSSGKSGEHTSASSSMVPESLKILQDCVIFVDVRTDDGDEAGSLFVEMLEGVGAKILTRVGQTCTHIVYKNGLTSTLTRYRLLRDPKPFVVGIAWVVECVEQRQRIDESKFIVNLDGVNVAGTNKRRRSMLPKLIRREAERANSDTERDGQSIKFDPSSSSIIMDEDLTPLELARRRRTGLRTP